MLIKHLTFNSCCAKGSGEWSKHKFSEITQRKDYFLYGNDDRCCKVSVNIFTHSHTKIVFSLTKVLASNLKTRSYLRVNKMISAILVRLCAVSVWCFTGERKCFGLEVMDLVLLVNKMVRETESEICSIRPREFRIYLLRASIRQQLQSDVQK